MILVEFFIEQAVLKLASPHTFAINNDQEEIRLIGKNLIICNIYLKERPHIVGTSTTCFNSTCC